MVMYGEQLYTTIHIEGGKIMDIKRLEGEKIIDEKRNVLPY